MGAPVEQYVQQIADFAPEAPTVHWSVWVAGVVVPIVVALIGVWGHRRRK